MLCAEMARLVYCRSASTFAFDEERIGAVLKCVGFTNYQFFETGSTHCLLAQGVEGLGVIAFRGTDVNDPTDLGDDADLLLSPWKQGGKVQVKAKVAFASKAEMQKRIRAAGFKTHGGIDKAKTSKDDDNPARSFPHFTQSFVYNGQEFPFTMVGYQPRSGKSTTVRPVIIPLRVRFQFFEQDA
jgi:hypothetical protein